MQADKSHQYLRTSARSGPPGLHPAPDLNWEAWRSHVKELKTAAGLSINDLAGRSGLDRSTVVELLGGRRGVGSARMDTLWALAWALEVEDFASFLAPLTSGLDDAERPATDSRSARRG